MIAIRSLAPIFDRLYAAEHKKELDRWVVEIGVLAFLAHLGHVFLARNLPKPPALIAAAGQNYLSAMSTPFSLMLFYEVLILISAAAGSTTQSIAKQSRSSLSSMEPFGALSEWCSEL